jgi:hypothetical protein
MKLASAIIDSSRRARSAIPFDIPEKHAATSAATSRTTTQPARPP